MHQRTRTRPPTPSTGRSHPVFNWFLRVAADYMLATSPPEDPLDHSAWTSWKVDLYCYAFQEDAVRCRLFLEVYGADESWMDELCDRVERFLGQPLLDS